MACIGDYPNCGSPDAPVVPEPLSAIGAIFLGVGSGIGAVGAVGSALGELDTVGGTLTVGGVAIGSAGVLGVLSALVTVILIIATIGIFAVDRCVAGKGLPECFAGVVQNMVGSFSSFLDDAFPFSATHDRVDLVVKSRFWEGVEQGGAYVYCTRAEFPRRSEIMRSYFYDARVCSAATAGIYGAGAGGLAGIIAGALAAVAIGCATVILCLLALIVAALIAGVLALIGAFAGGQIAKATSEDDSPTTETGKLITVGDYISVHGEMQRREQDNGANVLWWVSRTAFNGQAPSGDPSDPYSYCELDEHYSPDGCEPPLI